MFAPVNEETTLPSRKMKNAGTALTPSRFMSAAVLLLASPSTSTNWACAAYASANVLNVGLNSLHGPHLAQAGVRRRGEAAPLCQLGRTTSHSRRAPQACLACRAAARRSRPPCPAGAERPVSGTREETNKCISRKNTAGPQLPAAAPAQHCVTSWRPHAGRWASRARPTAEQSSPHTSRTKSLCASASDTAALCNRVTRGGWRGAARAGARCGGAVSRRRAGARAARRAGMPRSYAAQLTSKAGTTRQGCVDKKDG